MKLNASRVVPWLAATIAQATVPARIRRLRHRSRMDKLLAEIAALREENARLRAEADLPRARLGKIPPRQRPRYIRWLRLEVLWHRRRYGLSLPQAARAFVVPPQTISRWEADVQERSPRLVSMKPPANRPADIAEELVHRLKLEQADWGTRRIAQTLVRLGVRLSRSSVQRILRRPPPRRRKTAKAAQPTPPSSHRGPLRAKHPNHVWLIDLFTFQAPCRLRRIIVLAVLDLFSRLPLVPIAYESPPNARQVERALRTAFGLVGIPAHMVSDRGPLFPAKRLTRFLRRHRVRRRYGAVAKPQGVAAIDRWSQTIQYEYLEPCMLLLPLPALQKRLSRFAAYASRVRPHQGLEGRTPEMVHQGRRGQRTVDPRR